jgi:glycosyltransferase involved in cell wall biosynthesis
MQNMDKTICVIIPTYNEEHLISTCIKSIISAKKDRQIEIIVADNGSIDHTREIAQRMGARVIVDTTYHISGLRNFAASQTAAEILAFVDADCIVADDWIDRAEYYFDRLEIAVWGSPPIAPQPGTWVQRAWSLVRQKRREIQKVAWLESMNLWVRHDVFQKIGGFNADLTTCEDVDFGYRAGKHGLIISDSRIKVIHLGEASTIINFVQKELWRGQNNWTALGSHGWQIRELKNILIPIAFGFLLPAFIIAKFLLGGDGWLFSALFVLLCPSIVSLYLARGKKAGLVNYAALFVLLEIYFFCRTLSTAYGIFLKADPKRSPNTNCFK